MNKQQLNTLVTEYVESRNERDFESIYGEVIGKQRGKLGTIGKSIRADHHEALALYEDTLMVCIEKYDGKSDFENFFNWSVRNRRADTYRKKQSEHYYEDFGWNIRDEYEGTNESYKIESIYGSVTEDYFQTKRADQRKLIDSLLNGADETTTAIVEAFLDHPKPTATAIAKQLGCHHSKVLRALNRLAGKFDSRQYGDYSDYLELAL